MNWKISIDPENFQVFSLKRNFNFANFLYLSGILSFRACLHGVGVPQVGEVTRFGGVTRLSI